MIKLKPGDIILGSKNAPVTKIIMWFQSNPVRYAHCMVVCSGGKVLQSKKTMHYLTIDEALRKYPKHTIARYRFATEEGQKVIDELAEEMIGEDYSWGRICLQVFDHIFHTNWFSGKMKDVDDQVCSSAVAYVFDKAYGKKFSGVEWESCTPDDIDDDIKNNPDEWSFTYEIG